MPRRTGRAGRRARRATAASATSRRRGGHRAREPRPPPARDERGTPSRALAKCREATRGSVSSSTVRETIVILVGPRAPRFSEEPRLVLAKVQLYDRRTHTRRARVPRRRRTGHASDRTRATPRGDRLSDPPRCRSGPTGTDPHADRARANRTPPRTDASPNEPRAPLCDRAPSPSPRALADPAANLLLPPRSPVRVGTAHTTKSTRPHPLLARLMRERLREHSGHLEAQHREAGGDFDSDDDDARADAGGDVAGDVPRDEPRGTRDDADGSIVDDFDLHEDDEGGGFDSDAGRREETTVSKASRSKTSRAQKRAGAAATRRGRAAGGSGARRGGDPGRRFCRPSPSQRRALTRCSAWSVAPRLRLRLSAEAATPRARRRRRRRIGVFRAPRQSRRARPRRAPASSISRGARRAHPEKGGAPSVVSPPPRSGAHLGEARRRAVRPALPREEETLRSRPDEARFKPRISRKTRAMGADVHARENDGLPRVEYLLKKGTNVLRERAARTATSSSAGRRRAHGDVVSARVADPRAFLDEGSGGRYKPGGLVRARDQSLARH